MSDLQFDMIGCPICSGDGFLVDAVCCGNFHYANSHDQDNRYGYCCGSPNPVQVQCEECQGSGLVSPLPKFEDVDITIDNDKENPF